MSDRIQMPDMEQYNRGVRAILLEHRKELKEAETVYDTVVSEDGEQLMILPSLKLTFFNDQELVSKILDRKGVVPAMHVGKDSPKAKLH